MLSGARHQRAVISFDVGGTLTTSEAPTFTARVLQAAQLFGSPASEARELALTSLPDKRSKQKLYQLCGPNLVWPDRPCESQDLNVVPGAEDMLAEVATIADPVSLSNVSWVDATPLPGRLDDLLRATYRSCTIGVAKPAAGAFIAVARGEGVPVDELVHVGDSWREDILGALRVGARCIWLTSRWNGVPVIIAPGRLAICGEPDQVAPVVQALLKETTVT